MAQRTLCVPPHAKSSARHVVVMAHRTLERSVTWANEMPMHRFPSVSSIVFCRIVAMDYWGQGSNVTMAINSRWMVAIAHVDLSNSLRHPVPMFPTRHRQSARRLLVH